MGPIYTIESELRDLCKSPKENGNQIYVKLLELVRRLLARNPSKMGPDVDRESLIHEIASDITARLVAGTLDPIYKWSGYIMTILPRMTKENATINSQQIIDTYKEGIDVHKMVDMSHSGSISIMNTSAKIKVIDSVNDLPSTILSWLDNNVKFIDRDSRDYCNMRISILLSFVRGQITMYRLPSQYKNSLILYYNKFRVFLSRYLLSDNKDDNPYDQIIKISLMDKDSEEVKNDIFG